MKIYFLFLFLLISEKLISQEYTAKFNIVGTLINDMELPYESPLSTDYILSINNNNLYFTDPFARGEVVSVQKAFPGTNATLYTLVVRTKTSWKLVGIIHRKVNNNYAYYIMVGEPHETAENFLVHRVSIQQNTPIMPTLDKFLNDKLNIDTYHFDQIQVYESSVGVWSEASTNKTNIYVWDQSSNLYGYSSTGVVTRYIPLSKPVVGIMPNNLSGRSWKVEHEATGRTATVYLYDNRTLAIIFDITDFGLFFSNE